MRPGRHQAIRPQANLRHELVRRDAFLCCSQAYHSDRPKNVLRDIPVTAWLLIDLEPCWNAWSMSDKTRQSLHGNIHKCHFGTWMRQSRRKVGTDSSNYAMHCCQGSGRTLEAGLADHVQVPEVAFHPGGGVSWQMGFGHDFIYQARSCSSLISYQDSFVWLIGDLVPPTMVLFSSMLIQIWQT